MTVRRSKPKFPTRSTKTPSPTPRSSARRSASSSSTPGARPTSWSPAWSRTQAKSAPPPPARTPWRSSATRICPRSTPSARSWWRRCGRRRRSCRMCRRRWSSWTTPSPRSSSSTSPSKPSVAPWRRAPSTSRKSVSSWRRCDCARGWQRPTSPSRISPGSTTWSSSSPRTTTTPPMLSCSRGVSAWPGTPMTPTRCAPPPTRRSSSA
mmetsp:Transcript_20856/g.51125  ORF Transcript_20856/g.51125 Transcript_20856/m.51125 type:complete len:208 (-) Transcript_20856:317-940(-)